MESPGELCGGILNCLKRYSWMLNCGNDDADYCFECIAGKIATPGFRDDSDAQAGQAAGVTTIITVPGCGALSVNRGDKAHICR